MVESAIGGSTTKNGEVIVKNDGVSKEILPHGYELIGSDENYIIATSPLGEIVLKNKSGDLLFQYKLPVRGLSGSYNNKDYLAILTSNNEMVVIDIKKNKIVFKEKSKQAFTTTADIASPLFVEDLIIFPTLDGKLIVVDEKELKFIRDFIVGQQQFFTNVIYLKAFRDRIIAATSESIYSVGDNEIETLNKEVRFLIEDDNDLFLLTIDGQVILLDEMLKEQNSKKYHFARFVGVSQDEENLYIVEHSGYVIKLEKTLENEKIYGIPDNIDDYIFLDKNKIYYSRKIIVID